MAPAPFDEICGCLGADVLLHPTAHCSRGVTHGQQRRGRLAGSRFSRCRVANLLSRQVAVKPYLVLVK